MFKKFKDKLAEEMKQSPARLQASMQQLAQAVVSPALSTSSIQELSASNDNFSLTEEGDETPKNSPAKHGFQNVDLMSPTPNSMGISRRSSINSVTSDTSSLFPIYESPANLYHLQSDMDQSASEIEENINSQLDKVTKDQIYSAYRKVQAKYHKYRGRYTDLATHYRELERVKGKVESILVETQDKALRRVVDLKEQCQLEQQAKAHLEEALRNDIEEKDHIINTLNTKIKLLQSNGPNIDVIMSSATNTDKGNAEGVKDNLIDLNTNSLDNSTENSLLMENTQLKDKLKKLENVVLKYKESLKRNKEKFTEVLAEKNTLECNYAELKSSYAEKDTELNNAHTEIRNLADQIIILKKREEESAISLAENKLSIHRELEDKEEQIKKLQLDLKNMAESKESLNEVVKKYKIEQEKLKLIPSTQNVDSEKKDIVQDVLKGKSEAQQKPIILEDKIDVKPHEGDSNKENTKEMEETRIEDSEVYKNLKCKLDEKEIELQKLKNILGELQKLAEEYQNNKDKLCMELSDYKLRYTELKSEQDAQKIIAEEKKKEADAMVEKLQATVQNLDKELENMRSALIDRDKVCENYNAKVNEYKLILEKANEKLLAQDVEMKTLKEKEQQLTDMIKSKNELENKVSELLETCNEHQSCKSIILDLKNKLQMYNSDIDLLREEKNNLIKNILNHKISVQKLKTDNKRIKSDVTEHFMQFTNEIFGLKNVLDMCLEKKNAIQNFEAEDLQIKLKELEEFKQKYNELQTELKDTICIKSNLQANLEKYNEQLKEMSINLEQQNDIDVKNRKLIAEIDNLNFKLYDLRNVSEEMNSLKVESKFLKEDLINVNTSNQLLSDEISDLKTQLEKANNIKKELQEEYLNTMSLYKSENSKCNKLEETINSLQSEITVLNEIISEKDKQVNILNDELRNKESAVTNLKDECEDHTKVIGKLTKDKKTLQKTIQAKLNQLKESKAIEEKQALIIQQLNDEISKIKTTNTELLEQLKLLENEINALKSENDQIITLKNNNSSITSELEQLKSVQHTIDLENKNLKDAQNEFLERNQELHECNEKLKQEIVNYKKHNEQLLNNNEQLEKAIESHKSSLNRQKQDIQNLNSQIVALTAELQSKTENLNLQIEEFRLYKQEAEEMKDHFTKENKNLHNEICKLDVALKNRESTDERNKELLANLELLEKEHARLEVIEEENSNLKLEISSLNETKINSEKMQLQYNELSNEYVTLKNKVTELENVNSINVELQSHVNNVEAKISSLELVESNNSKFQLELNTLKAMNTELLTQVNNKSIENEQLLGELGELKLTVDEKVAELKLLDTRNMELLREIERLKSLTIEDEAITETDTFKNTIECMKDEITRLQTEAEILKKSNIVLQEKVQNGSANKTIDDSFTKESDRLQEENKKLEAQLDEALITFQAKELQMQIVNNELKSQADKLKEELKTNEEEQSMRLKQLVKEFQAQLHDKEEELHAALEKRFDQQQNYESNLIQQYKEQLKDFQIELTTKSEQIENLILENKNLIIEKNKDINQLMEKITVMKKEHADEMREIEKKWKSIVQQKTDKLEAKHDDEINELTREWRNERRPDVQNDLTYKELESTSRVAMAAVQSNTGSFHTLQQTLTAQRRELAELRKLVKLRHDTLEDSTEIEYLRNILFEYMMGKETMVLARVIAAVVKFDQDQTAKILKKEEDKMTLLGSLGLT